MVPALKEIFRLFVGFGNFGKRQEQENINPMYLFIITYINHFEEVFIRCACYKKYVDNFDRLC